MKLRVVSPVNILTIYLGIELLAVPFFLLILFEIGPYAFLQDLPSCRMVMLFFLSVAILIPFLFECYGFGSHRCLFDERGVSYQMGNTAYHLDWNEIRQIALMPDAMGQLSKSGYVCFFADESLSPILGRKGFSERAFGVQYRKGLPELIARYCGKEIAHLDAVENKKRG